MNPLKQAIAFVAVADRGSFSAAAEQLRWSQPAVSKIIAELERRLETQLLQRSTRSLKLTEAGQLFLPHARHLLAAATNADAALSNRDPLAGLVSFTCPPSLANARVIPSLGEFMIANPQIEIDAQLSDTRQTLAEGTLDFSIRVGGLGNEPLESRLIGIARRILVASPAYLARSDSPSLLSHLAQHKCLHYRLSDGQRRWQFSSGAAVEVAGPLSIDNPEGLRAAALAGLGIVQSAIWLFEDDLAAGRLVPVLAHDPPMPMPIHLVRAKSRPLSIRAAAVANHIAARFDLDPLIRVGGND